MTDHVTNPVATMSEARHELCRRLAEIIREGNIGMQIRFVTEGDVHRIWVYAQQHHEWKKRDDRGISDALAEPLWDLLEGLVSQKYSDVWTCHRHEHHDRVEFELKFNRASLEPHERGDLESYLLGCLSHEHHDSGMDSRRKIRFRKG